MKRRRAKQPWQITLGITIRRVLFSFYKRLNLTKKQTVSSKDIEKILIIRTDRLGDAVVITPLLRAIKDNLPDKKLYILCSKQNQVVFKENPFIDKMFFIDTSPWLSYSTTKIPVFGPIFNFIYSVIYHIRDREFLSVLSSIKSENIDVAFDAVGRRRTALLTKYLGNFTIGHKLSEVIFLYNYYTDYLWVDTRQKKHIAKRLFEAFFTAIEP